MLPAANAPERLGRYELLLKLGRGGMAELFLGRLTAAHDFAKIVAIKRILPHLADDPAFVAMFLNEGRIAARLTHLNVCSVYELIEHDGARALVMEYLAGVSWDTLAAAAPRDRQGARLAASVLAQACDGLHYAHTLQLLDGAPSSVIHRDVSPQNLFVTTEGVCKVLDFGVSKISSDPRRTATGVIKGKLPYLAPEQLRGEAVDARADLWALGAVLWEALTGRRLFERATDYLTYEAIEDATIPTMLLADPRPRPTAEPDIDRVLGPVIGRALQRDPELRYASARELADDLRAAADALGGTMSHAQIAEALRAWCGDALAARSREVAAVLGGAPLAVMAAAPPPPAPATISVVLRDRSLVVAAPDAPDAPAPLARAVRDTAITDLRDRPVAPRGSSRRWRWRAAIGLTGAVLIALIVTREEPAAAPGPIAPTTALPTPTPQRTAPTATTPTLAQTTAATPAAPTPAAPTLAQTTAATPAASMTASPTIAPTTAASPTIAPTTAAASSALAASPTIAPTTAATSSALTAAASDPSRPAPAAAKLRSRKSPVRSEAKPEPRPAASAEPASAAHSGSHRPGYYAVDSKPYATVFVDGALIGDTPLYKVPLGAGTHTVRARLVDGRQRTFQIQIAADRESSSVLAW